MSDTPRTDAAMVDAKCPHCAGMGGFQVSEEEAQGCELCGTTGKVNVIPNGCGESLRTTERELAAARAELAEASECLRECIANFGELCAGGDKRWRKAAGVDTATPTNSGKS